MLPKYCVLWLTNGLVDLPVKPRVLQAESQFICFSRRKDRKWKLILGQLVFGLDIQSL